MENGVLGVLGLYVQKNAMGEENGATDNATIQLQDLVERFVEGNIFLSAGAIWIHVV